ncbi:MAG: glycosyltransferase, partial [Myxococcota bacterium]
MTRARILIVAYGRVPSDTPTPAETAATALRGELDIVALRGDGQAHQGRLGDTRIFRVQAGGIDGFARAVQRQLEGEKYDAIHLCGPEGLCGSLPPIVVYDASFVHADEGWVARHNRALAAAGHVIVPTPLAKERAAPKCRGSVLHLSPGVALDQFDQDDGAADEALRILCLDAGQAGRDLNCLLDALPKLSRPYQLMLAGVDDASARLELRKRVEERGLSASVTVRGTPSTASTPALIAYADVALSPMAAHDAFVHAALLPQPLLEYWACGTPVVAPDFDGLRSLRGPDEDHIAYAAGDPASLARAIEVAAAREGAPVAYEWARGSRGISATRRGLRTLYEHLRRKFSAL